MESTRTLGTLGASLESVLRGEEFEFGVVDELVEIAQRTHGGARDLDAGFDDSGHGVKSTANDESGAPVCHGDVEEGLVRAADGEYAAYPLLL